MSAGLLAEGLVHGVGARGAVSDWTTSLNRGTTAGTGSVCRSSGRSRGSGGTTGPSPPTSESAPYAIRTHCRSPAPGLWTPPLPMDAKSAPTGSLENREERGFPQRPQPSFHLLQDLHEKTGAGAGRTGGCRELISFSRLLTRAARPFRGPLRTPPIPGAHQHYTELRRCRSCGTLQMVNVGPSGEHEASAWFRAAEDCMPWQGLHDAAIAAGSPIGRD